MQIFTSNGWKAISPVGPSSWRAPKPLMSFKLEHVWTFEAGSSPRPVPCNVLDCKVCR